MTPNHPTGGVALITGGGGGIGGATAERLAANGVAIAIADFNLHNADDVRDGLLAAGGAACSIALDVTDPGSVIAGGQRRTCDPVYGGRVSKQNSSSGLSTINTLIP